MFDPALTATGARPTSTRPPTSCVDDHRGARRQGRRHQGLAAGRRPRGRAAPPAAGRGPALHRRRLQLPGADPGRRGRPLRRAARHLRRDRARPPPRRWPRSDAGDLRVRRAPRADGAAGPAPLRGADLVLQDRHRLPGLAGRAPGPLHDGRRPADRPVARRTWPTPAHASPTRPGCSRDADLAAGPRLGRTTVAGVAVDRVSRCQPATRPPRSTGRCRTWSPAARRPACRASACGGAGRRVRRWTRRPRAGPRRRPGGHVAVPGRLLHRRRPSGATRGQPARHRRGRHARARRAGAGLRWAAARPGTSTAPARVADAIGRAGPARGRRGVRLAIEPLHPMFCSTAAWSRHARPGAGHRRAVPGVAGRRVSWTRTTCGGTPGLPADRAGRRADRRVPGLRLGDPAAGGHAARARLLGDGSIELRRLREAVTRPATTGRSRWRSSTRSCGTRPDKRSSTWRWRAIRNTSSSS